MVQKTKDEERNEKKREPLSSATCLRLHIFVYVFCVCVIMRTSANMLHYLNAPFFRSYPRLLYHVNNNS